MSSDAKVSSMLVNSSVGDLRKKRRYSTLPLQNNIDITLGHTACITSAFARPFHLDITSFELNISDDLGPLHLDVAKLPEGL